MSDILSSVKRVLFTKSRRRGAGVDTTVSTSPTQNPYDHFDIFEPVSSNADAPAPSTAPPISIDDDDDAISGVRIGLWGHIRYSRIGIWIGGARIKVRSGLSVRQRIKRYNAIYKGGYGAPDTKVKKEC